MSNKEHEKLAREAWDKLQWSFTKPSDIAIILAAIEKAAKPLRDDQCELCLRRIDHDECEYPAAQQRSVLADVPDCKCVQQGYPEPDCKWHGMGPQEWTPETVQKRLQDISNMNKEHEKLARDAAEQIWEEAKWMVKHNSEIILAALEKAASETIKSDTTMMHEPTKTSGIKHIDTIPNAATGEPGEWTVRTVQELGVPWSLSVCMAIADAHNAALAAAYEKGKQDGIREHYVGK